MIEQQYDFIAGDFVEGITPENTEPKFKYLRIEVEKTLSTWIFVKVPEKFDIRFLTRKDISDMIDDQNVRDYDWEQEDWLDFTTSVTDEKEANQYGYSEFPLS